MSSWKKLWRCKYCDNLNQDYALRCAKCGKGKAADNAWRETVYQHECGHCDDRIRKPCPKCGK
ncbi:MAG: hypothetical protein QW304_08905 [Thermoproteota archaeon]